MVHGWIRLSIWRSIKSFCAWHWTASAYSIGSGDGGGSGTTRWMLISLLVCSYFFLLLFSMLLPPPSPIPPANVMRQCVQCELHILSFHSFIKRFKSVSFQVDVPINRTFYGWFFYLSCSFSLFHSFCVPFCPVFFFFSRSILYLQLGFLCVTEFFLSNHCSDPFISYINFSFSFFFVSLICSHSDSLFTVFMSDSIAIARYICDSNGT